LYGVSSADPRLGDTENGRAYARWAKALEGLLDAEDWITSVQLPDRLVRLIDGPSTWRPPVAAAIGYDEPATAIRRFLTASRRTSADSRNGAIPRRVISTSGSSGMEIWFTVVTIAPLKHNRFPLRDVLHRHHSKQRTTVWNQSW